MQARAHRHDYVPQVKARETYLGVPVKPRIFARHIRVVSLGATDTSATALINGLGPRGHRRIIRIRIVQNVTDGKHVIELYFGTGASIYSSPTKAIDILNVPDLGEDATRTYSEGTGPVGLHAEQITYRFKSAPAAAGNHDAIVEYTTEH